MTTTTTCPSWCTKHATGGNPNNVDHYRPLLDEAAGWAQPRGAWVALRWTEYGPAEAAFLDHIKPRGREVPGPQQAAAVHGSDLDADACRRLAAALLEAADLLDQDASAT